MKKTKVTIGIPALNEEANIVFLLQDILAQRARSIVIEKIIVASDGSKDNTVKYAKSVKNKKITVINGNERKGKSYRLNQIISLIDTDCLVLLDADTQIFDAEFIEKLVDPISSNRADFTSAALIEMPPRTFFEEVLDVSMRVKRVLFSEFKSGHNLYNCHGPARALSREFYSKLNFRNSAGDDMYSYLECINFGMRFNFVKEAKIGYRLPANFEDHARQSVRYLNSIDMYSRLFDQNLVDNEFSIPKRIYLISGIKSFPLIIRYPVHFAIYLFSYFYIKYGSSRLLKFDTTWEILSSKNLRENYGEK